MNKVSYLKKNIIISIFNIARKCTSLPIIVSILFYSSIQQPALGQDLEKIEQLSKIYKGESIVNLLSRSYVRIYFGKDGEILLENNPTERRLYLSDNASSYSSSSISYSTNFELENVEAQTIYPEDGKQKVEKVKKFSKKKVFRSGIFHDGSVSMNFFYPSLTKGALSEISYTLRTDIPQFLNSFYIEDYYPTLKREMIIEMDNGINIDFTVFNANPEDFQPIIEKGRKTTIYRWELDSVPAYEYDDNAPSLSYYSPIIIPRITSYTYKGETKSVLANLDDFYKWCYDFVDETDKEPSEEIKTITDSLISGSESELEKIRKIYYWVQDNVKYVAFEEGLQGFIPESASAVCQKRYGDCKGMTSLLYTMLRYAGIEAYFTWIGTRETPYSQEEVPTPLSQDHMILTYKLNDEYYFMDGTSEFSPAGEPSSMIMGKNALIGIDRDNYVLLPVVATSAEYSTYHDSIKIVLNDDTTIKGYAKSTMTGFYKSAWLSVLKKRTDKEIKDIMDEFLQRGNNKFKLDTFHLSEISQRDEPFEIQYEFTLTDYANLSDSLTFINLNLNTLYSNKTMDKERKTPYSQRYKSTSSSVVVMDIPEGYAIEHLPESSEYENELFGFTYDVHERDGQVIQRFKQQDKFILLDTTHFDEWNKMVKKLSQAQRKSISLIKK